MTWEFKKNSSSTVNRWRGGGVWERETDEENRPMISFGWRQRKDAVFKPEKCQTVTKTNLKA